MRNLIDLINETQREWSQRDWSAMPAGENTSAKATATVGALYRSKFRRLLDQLQFQERIDSYTESKGFLSSDFHIKAPYATLEALKRMSEQLEADE